MIDFQVRKTSSPLMSVAIADTCSSKRAELRLLLKSSVLLAQVDLCAVLELYTVHT